MNPTELSELSDDELYAQLGARLLGEGRDFGPEDFERFVQFGRNWLDRNIDSLRNRVCNSETVEVLLRNSEDDWMLEIAAVTDALASWPSEAGAAVLAVLLVRRGLRIFCRTG